MKRNTIFILTIAVVIAICILIIIITATKNKAKLINTTNTQGTIVTESEASKMTDDELISKITSGEQGTVLDTPENDNIISDLDNTLNEKDPLSEMPTE